MSDNEMSDTEPELSEEEEEVSNSPTFTLKKNIGNMPPKIIAATENDDNEDMEDDDDLEDDDFQDLEEDSNNQPVVSKNKANNINPSTGFSSIIIPDEFEEKDSDYDSDSDEEDENYLQKFEHETRENYIMKHHQEEVIHNADEISALSKVLRNKENMVVDELHRTIPILTKFEKTRILGLRAKQINNGAKPYIKLDKPVIDGELIALKELEAKKLPFIIRRPVPNGAFEYWPLQELEIM